MEGRTLERGREGEGSVTSLIFPTYNPGALLERTWAAVADFLRRAPGNWEVLFVCDGCTDGSPGRLARLAQTAAGQVRVLSYAPNRGKGYAVRHGLAACCGAWRLFTDVDLAYDFGDLLRVAEALQAGAEVVIGSRAHPDSQMALPTRLQGYVYRRHLQSLAFSALVRLLLPLTQRDTQAGLKGISARAARLVLPHLACDGFGFDCELLTACVRYGLPIVEVPVNVRYEDRASTTNLGTVGRMVRELWRIRRHWRQAPPPQPGATVEPGRRAA
jgi:glycosyltransferase involved in cell wall biosynthesis